MIGWRCLQGKNGRKERYGGRKFQNPFTGLQFLPRFRLPELQNSKSIRFAVSGGNKWLKAEQNPLE